MSSHCSRQLDVLSRTALVGSLRGAFPGKAWRPLAQVFSGLPPASPPFRERGGAQAWSDLSWFETASVSSHDQGLVLPGHVSWVWGDRGAVWFAARRAAGTGAAFRPHSPALETLFWEITKISDVGPPYSHCLSFQISSVPFRCERVFKILEARHFLDLC